MPEAREYELGQIGLTYYCNMRQSGQWVGTTASALRGRIIDKSSKSPFFADY